MNNLRVDVILETEQRSAGPVNLKQVGRITGVVIGIVVISLAGSFVVRLRYAQNERDGLKKSLGDLQPVLAKVKEYQKEVTRNKDLVGQISGWNKARLAWYQHMADFRGIVPKEIQVTRMMVSDQLLVQGNTASIELQGTAQAVDAAGAVKAVDDFRMALRNGPGFSNVVESVELKSCDEPKGHKNQRVFRITAKYCQRPF